jgi:hypothetical protein
MIDFGMIGKNKTEARESPILWFPGVNDYFQYQVDGTGSITAQSMYLYENGVDVSSTKLSGSLSVSGRVIKSKVISSLVGGNIYKVYFYFTDSGVQYVHEVSIYCPKLGVNPSHYPLAHNTMRIKDAPILIYPGQVFTASMSVEGNGVIASPTMYVYKGLNDDSANALSSDAIVVTGRNIQLKSIQNLSGGTSYLLYVFFTDDGRSTCRYAEIICPKLGER